MSFQVEAPHHPPTPRRAGQAGIGSEWLRIGLAAYDRMIGLDP